MLEITFSSTDQSALLHGSVWARPAQHGVWLELAHAAQCLEKLESTPRGSLRIASNQLVLAEGAGQPALLCRLRDVGEDGARLAASAEHLGGSDARLSITLPEAGPTGAQLQAFGRLAWAGEGEVGVEWIRGDLASRAAVRRVMETAQEEWEGARSASHQRTCRCMPRSAAPEVLLLG